MAEPKTRRKSRAKAPIPAQVIAPETSLDDTSSATQCAFGATSRRLCDRADCRACMKKSFASHPRASCWFAGGERDAARPAEGNTETPRAILLSSSKKFYFECDVCHHLFIMSLRNVISGKSWCPYCSDLILCNKADCAVCEAKSFASHPRVSCWSARNAEDPRNVFMSSGKKYFFDCDVCHRLFEIALYSVAAGNWCPYCQ